MRKYFLLLLVAGCGGTPDLNPHPWLKWDVGSRVTFRVTMEDRAGTMTKELLSVDDAGYTLRLTSDLSGQPLPITQQNDRGALHAPSSPQAVLLRNEFLTVDGKTFDCQVWQALVMQNNQEVKSTMWYAKGEPVPVRILLERTRGGRTELTATSMSEEVTVAGRTFVCVRLEGTMENANESGTLVQWRTPEIPGGIAKIESDRRSNTGRYTVLLEVDSFEK